MIKDKDYLYHPLSDLGGLEVFKIGEVIRWRSPLDADYSYGTILAIKRSVVIIAGTGYYTGLVIEVNRKYIRKLKRGGGGFGSR